MGEAVEGRRRTPEESLLHEAFRRGWPEVSSSMPSRVKLEVERFLTCGDLRFGFVEVTCESCAASRIVAWEMGTGCFSSPPPGDPQGK